MTDEERAKVIELLDALAMTAYGISTDIDHYRRLARAVEATEKMLKIKRGSDDRGRSSPCVAR